jgi:hypothetical protein
MLPISYVTPVDFLISPPGGMRTKTHRVLEAGEGVDIELATLDEINTPITLIDPLYFRLAERDNDECLAVLRSYSSDGGKIVLYQSELELIRMSDDFRRDLLEVCDVVTFNSKYQRGVTEAVMGSPLSQVPFALLPLTDPIPDVHGGFPENSDRPRAIVLGYMDRKKGLPELCFHLGRLKELNFEITVVGSAGFWNCADHLTDLSLAEIADEHFTSVSQSHLERLMSESYYYVSCSYHDVFSSSYYEACRSGALPALSDRPHFAGRPCVNLRGKLDRRPKQHDNLRRKCRAFFEKHASYGAFQHQLDHILESII